MSDSTFPSRWRFSTRTLLGCTVILALAITVWLQWRELDPLREEVLQLRAEGGHLTIDDPSRLHAIDVPIPMGNHWRWRVYVPDTGSYQLCFQQANIPAEGVPSETSKRMTFPLDAGEHRLDAEIDYRGGELPRHVVTLSSLEGVYGEMELFESTEDWLDPEGAPVNPLCETLSNRTVSFSASEPAILLRYRPLSIPDPPAGDGSSKYTFESVPTPSDGLMLWIERIP
jgi:hypothetical protein